MFFNSTDLYVVSTETSTLTKYISLSDIPGWARSDTRWLQVDTPGRRLLVSPGGDRQKIAIYSIDSRGLALIDDRPEVDTNNGRAPWCHVVFDCPYNRHSGAALRIRRWDDPHLEDNLEAARRRAKAQGHTTRPLSS